MYDVNSGQKILIITFIIGFRTINFKFVRF